MTTITEEDTARILGGIKLPPRPAAMAAIAEEKAKDEPVVLEFLDLTGHEFADLRDDVHELLTHES